MRKKTKENGSNSRGAKRHRDKRQEGLRRRARAKQCRGHTEDIGL